MELKALREKWDAARTQAQTIIRDHETKAMDADTRTRLRTFLDEAEGYKEQFELKQRDDALGTFERTPLESPLLNTALTATPGEATVLGLYGTPSGSTTIESKGGSYLVTSEGEGLIEQKTLAAIRTPEYKSAYHRYLRAREGIGGLDSASRKLLTEVKAAQEGLDPSGGYLVPEDLINRMISRTMAPMRLAGKVTRIPTSRDSVVMPKVNYKAESDTPANVYDSPVRVAWTGEIPASSTVMRTTDLPFGMSRIPVYTAMVSLLLTMDMLEDAAFPIASYVGEKFGNTVQILYDNMILNGTGVGQPRGILQNPDSSNARPDKDPAVVVSGSAAALTWDGLQDLAYALPEQYDDGATMVFNKGNTARAIAGLVDGNGRPFWGMGTQDSGLESRALGRPLLGYDTTLSALMPNVGASNYPIILGNFGGYALVERVGFTVRQLSELYAETNQVLLLGRVRFGGDILEPWKFKIHQCHT